jgi:hypothetical protein
MTTIYIPELQVESVTVGSTTVSNPTLFVMEIGGVFYGDQYTDSTDTYSRTVFPTFDSTTSTVKLTCVSIAIRANCPALTLSNIKVFIIG